MHVIHNATPRSQDTLEAASAPMSVVFADAEAIEAVRQRGEGPIVLSPPFHVSEADAYLVLPDDIGIEIVDIMRDGDIELLHEAMRDGLIVQGTIEQKARGVVELFAEAAVTPADLLTPEGAYGAKVSIGAGTDPLETINQLEHLQCTVVSDLLDDDGLDRVLRSNEYVGIGWRAACDKEQLLGGVDPTFVWARKRGPGVVGIEAALFMEYEELVMLIRPVELVAAS